MAEGLARMLAKNGVEVREVTGPVTVAGRTLPARGTYIVPMAQPAHRLAHDLLDEHVPMDEAFIQRQVDRRAERLQDEIYDVTAWSQSLLSDVEVLASDDETGVAGAIVMEERPPAQNTTLAPALVGYLIPWGSAAASTVAEALREGIRIRSGGGEFVLGDRTYAVGTAIVRTGENGPDLALRLGAIAAKHGAEVVPIDDSYVREGMSLGSRRVRALREPRVLLVYDRPGATYSVGWARYVLERRYGQRTTVVRTSSLGRVSLSDFDVVIFPSGNYSGSVGGGLVRRLQDWMRDGGTLITLG